VYHKVVSDINPSGFTWKTVDPFLFCVHHRDHYPKGNGYGGPNASLDGRFLGQDFTLKDGWRMYHGSRIPGFPAHPHRGFETVTVVLNGFVDHSDSHGSAGRYGNGDVQWMTAGAGLQHAEMFPLLNSSGPNPLELFQIWLNSPKEKKFSKPFYKMLWAEDIPILTVNDSANRTTQITLVAGHIGDTTAPAPAPDSWAADPDNNVGIWLFNMEPDAEWTVPAAAADVNRTLYFYKGDGVNAGGVDIPPYHSVTLLSEQKVALKNGKTAASLLLLQGSPINEPVVRHGPFVMNTREEIHQAFDDYRRTGFGGWPWQDDDNIHSLDKGRFARHADGREEIR
jgi:quercetin 2,3-dioxygenase